MPFPTYNQPGYFGQSYQSPQTMPPTSSIYSQGFGGLQQQQAQQQQQATPVTNKIYVIMVATIIVIAIMTGKENMTATTIIDVIENTATITMIRATMQHQAAQI